MLGEVRLASSPLSFSCGRNGQRHPTGIEALEHGEIWLSNLNPSRLACRAKSRRCASSHQSLVRSPCPSSQANASSTPRSDRGDIDRGEGCVGQGGQLPRDTGSGREGTRADRWPSAFERSGGSPHRPRRSQTRPKVYRRRVSKQLGSRPRGLYAKNQAD